METEQKNGWSPAWTMQIDGQIIVVCHNPQSTWRDVRSPHGTLTWEARVPFTLDGIHHTVIAHRATADEAKASALYLVEDHKQAGTFGHAPKKTAPWWKFW